MESRRPSPSFIRSSALPFVAGSLVTAAIVLVAASPRQGAGGGSGSAAGGRGDATRNGGASNRGAAIPDSDREVAGPPKVSQSGSEVEIKGPPRTGGQGAGAGGPMGYSNPGGMVDASALQAAAATGGIHYHVHYHGDGGATAGYAPTSFVNPATVAPTGDAAQYMPGYGPGNPGPLGSEAGLDANPAVGSRTYTGFTGYGAAGNYFGGPGGYFGGGGGVAPSAMAANAAYANAGYVSGFND